ncbi:MAG TPA: sigma-70 family RNA polymerase sigma factor [Candidatus Limnocylindria bacterium]|nr:sigma-70 family RNA polymerase sigma factor [Candidatus Limnocylindria bacterium]
MRDTTVAERPTFEVLVRPHLGYLYSLALKLTGARPEAEDLVQDTLLRAFRAAAGLREPDRCRFWLTKIAYSAWHDRYRREAAHDADVSIDDERFSLFDAVVEEDPFPYSDRLHLDFLDLFDDRRLDEALQKIHPAHRTALVLAYVHGFKAREIAELTGTTVGTVLARLHRGRKQLERAMWDYAKERGLLQGEVRR